MSIEVKVPTVGESISSGIIASWNKKDGDAVAANEPLFTLETDKVSTEIVAEAAGRLSIKAVEGEEVKIGQVVGLIEEGAGAAAPAQAAAAGEAPPKAAPSPSPDAQTGGAARAGNLAAAAENGGAQSAELSPAVRRMIEEEKLDPAAISGTGKGGRLTKEDLTAYIESRNASGAAPQPSDGAGAQKAAPSPVASAPAPAAAAAGRETRKKLSPLRRKIAAQLVMAQQTAAILTTFNECDMSGVMALRSKMQDSFVKKHGIKLGFMSFFIKAAVDALKSVPAVNGRMDGDDFIQNNFYDIGVAVGTDKGLFVPVVRDCDKKSFAQLEKDIVDYAKKARDGKIGLADLQGGGFTITNGGTYGSLLSTPILNPPQSGILGMHNIVQRPIVVKGEIAIRPMMYLALSYDHRVVDGKEAVTFLVRIKDCIEDPSRLLLEV
jgi:2-oxoglutarate dehydrogenase E2 component (dihydrolipoamide succinyltransferase)